MITINWKFGAATAAATLLAAWLGACNDDNNGQGCIPGEKDCICNQDLCLPGLECINEVCTEPMQCQPGGLGCECIGGQCLGDLECVNDLCLDPNCTLGEQYCGCLPGNLCTGDFECVNDLCVCAENSYYRCSNGDVYWFDSCGVQGELKDECADDQLCVNKDDVTAICQPNGGGTCGDGVIEGGEECEGSNFDGATCMSEGFGGGDLACTNACTIDTSACDSCGNGEIDPGEACDGNDFGNASCESQGYAPGGVLACTSDCEFDPVGCSDCGNGVVDQGDPGEDCDGNALGGESCESQGFPLGGQLGCSGACTFDVSNCTDCPCDAGQCCDGCSYEPANVVCEDDAETEYGCPWGTNPGDDVAMRTRDQYCSGASESCSGAYGMWSNWAVADTCGSNEYCSPGDSTCNVCNYNYAVTLYQCGAYSAANGGGNGGGEIFRVCATTDGQGYMTVKARKFDGSTFGNRPYQVRVSDPQNDPCGPNTNYFVISDSDPVGIGTNEITFSFQSQWLVGQTEKAYCVTASTQQGDVGYNANNPQQQSWWWSDKSVLERTCN